MRERGRAEGGEGGRMGWEEGRRRKEEKGREKETVWHSEALFCLHKKTVYNALCHTTTTGTLSGSHRFIPNSSV